MQDTKCPSESYRFTFGKYKGLTWEYVASNHPNYVHWCVKNIPWFKIPEGCVMPRVQRRVIFIEDDDYWDDPYDSDGWGGEWDW